MAVVLTIGATILCSHTTGIVQKAPSPKLKIDGEPVISAVGGLTGVVGCTNTLPGTPPPLFPCATVTIVSGQTTKLKVDGKPVLLSTATALLNPTSASITVTPSKIKLRSA